MAEVEKKSRLKTILEWVGIIGGSVAVLVLPVTIGLFINNKQHNMEMIEQNQKHNLELQRQHDEFEERYSELKDKLEDCKQQYRLLELENRKDDHEK